MPHGFERVFRDWAVQETNLPREVIEAGRTDRPTTTGCSWRSGDRLMQERTGYTEPAQVRDSAEDIRAAPVCGRALAALGVAARLEAHGAAVELWPQPVVAPVLRSRDAEGRRPDQPVANR